MTPPTIVFTAMGSTCDVTVVGGPPGLCELAHRRVHELEQRWSRFIATSELSTVNDNPGVAHRVSADTYLLIDHGVAAWRWTSGRFDPTVLNLMIQAGYDRSFTLGLRVAQKSVRGRAPGCDGIALDPIARTVTLGYGVGIDPGGYGKGLAADLAVEALLDAGATGACVNLGGDLRAAGEPPDTGWRVGIANPLLADDLITTVRLEDHGLATSNRLIRRWGTPGQERNHLLDPASGSSVNGLISASVISGQAWWSEVLAKVAMVDARARRTFIPLMGAEGLYVQAGGEVAVSSGFSEFAAT